jgi:hypothetical protein
MAIADGYQELDKSVFPNLAGFFQESGVDPAVADRPVFVDFGDDTKIPEGLVRIRLNTDQSGNAANINLQPFNLLADPETARAWEQSTANATGGLLANFFTGAFAQTPIGQSEGVAAPTQTVRPITDLAGLGLIKEELIGQQQADLEQQIREGLEREQEALASLDPLLKERERLLEEQLQTRLSDIDVARKVGSRQTGEVFAERNLLRSSFAQEAQQAVQLGALQERTGAIVEADIQKTAGREAKEKIHEQVQQQKEKTEFQLQTADLEQLIKERQFLDEGEIKLRFQNELNRLKMDAMEKQRLTQTYSSLISTGAFLTAAFI